MIHMKDVTVGKQGRIILDGINLHISPGEHTAVIGPNGSGKSSLLKLLTKEYHPVYKPEMRMELFGRQQWDVLELRRKLGIITPELQSMCSLPCPALDVVLSGFFSSIGIFPAQHALTPEMKQTALHALESLKAGHLSDLPMHTLSSGEARRILIARSLIHDPEALILDEPFDSLDIKGRKSLSDTLSSLAGRGRTIILVTHEFSDLIPEIKRVILMKDGKICKDGERDSLLTEETLSSLFETRVSLSSRQLQQ